METHYPDKGRSYTPFHCKHVEEFCKIVISILFPKVPVHPLGAKKYCAPWDTFACITGKWMVFFFKIKHAGDTMYVTLAWITISRSDIVAAAIFV